MLFSLYLTIYGHVTANPNSGPAKGYFVSYFRIGHACTASESTTSVEIQIPDGIYTAKPKFTAGWTYNVTSVALDKPISNGESTITSKVTKVLFTSAAGLPNDAFEDLGLSFQLPDAAGSALFFKTTQFCTSNTTAWVNIPANNDPAQWETTPKPAPYIKVLAAEGSSSADTTAATHDPTVLGIGVAGIIY
eukprot:NODE_506_length_6690_cov_0.762858.p3 type:complete len:191 gc:universal NODE_506_length_6690_cov_0.762858:754-1326(+)